MAIFITAGCLHSLTLPKVRSAHGQADEVMHSAMPSLLLRTRQLLISTRSPSANTLLRWLMVRVFLCMNWRRVNITPICAKIYKPKVIDRNTPDDAE